MKLFDLTIIGAGPAGMTAAIYAARADKAVAIIDKNGFGGQIANSPKVENYPGFASISGIGLAETMFSQMMNLPKIEHIIDEVVSVKHIDNTFICALSDETAVRSKSLIIATGSKPREIKLDTKNIYYCATCDGPFFKGEDVIVVGSGNTGAVYALDLITYCNKVYLCDTAAKMMCEASLAKRIEESKNIEFIPNCTIKSVNNKADGNLDSVILNTGRLIKVSAIFGAIGMMPQTDFISPDLISKDKSGYFISAACEIPNIPGLFVAGDCRTNQVKQVTTATADGTTAALKAIRFINSKQ